MKKNTTILLLLCLILSIPSLAQNPLIRDQFTADPSARVFGDKVYVFPSHDFMCTEEKGRVGWFCMEDYHVFSSPDLMNWTDHGVIVSQQDVKWANKNTYSMWAPDCIERNGKYYFYFPTIIQDTVKYWRGFGIGLAVADKPEGPYAIQPEPMKNVRGIDPNVFIDKDGQAYLYWSAGNIYGAKLKENMLELASEPIILKDLPAVDKGLKEGPYMIERNGIYYLTYPHVANKTERLEYAMGDNPLGPFKVTGVIMDESPTGCWTNHHSILEFKDQWYLFYHHNDLSPEFDKNRSIRVDSLFFNEDGTIQKVIPTLRGVGLTPATDLIQPDRYSAISESGIYIDFLDTLDRFKGWKTTFQKENAWVRYDGVDFGKSELSTAKVRAKSELGGTIQVRSDGLDGELIAEVQIPAGTAFDEHDVKLSSFQPGVHNLFIVLKEGVGVELDWISFQ